MTIAYQIMHDYGDYSHSEVLEQSLDYDSILKSYNVIVDSTNLERELGTDVFYTDCILLEQIQVTLDDDGNIEDVTDYQDVLAETIYNPYPD
jgi:hypothetical protein